MHYVNSKTEGKAGECGVAAPWGYVVIHSKNKHSLRDEGG
jgi:hypothetical protein